MQKLNLGCGQFKKVDYINVDIDFSTSPDITHNLDNFPYPFKKDYFDLIEGDHVLEHLKDPFKVMKELHRILKPGGKLIIRVPHFSRGFTHADHKRGFNVSFPLYFNPDYKGGYIGPDFKLEKMKLTWFTQEYLQKNLLPTYQFHTAKFFGKIIDFFANLSPYFCSRIWCYWVGGFEEVSFVFIK